MAKQVVESEVLIDVEVKGEDEANESVEELTHSIGELTKANKQLREERNKLDLKTEEGRKVAAKLNEQIDKNNKVIKDNSSALEKQRFNVGNYTGALDKLIPGLGSTIQGIQGMTKAAWAFVANPIGAILAALVLVFATIYAAVQRTTGGLDKFEQVTAALGAALNVIIDRLARFGEGLIKLLSGDVSGGLDQIADSFKGIGDEMEREIKAAYELQIAIQNLEDAEINYGIAAKETNNEIKQLILQSKNRLTSEEERIKLLDKALALERGLVEQELKNKNEAIRVAVQQAELDRNSFETIRKKGESEYGYGKRLIESGELIDENRDKLVEALGAYQDAIGGSIQLQEKLVNQQDTLADKLAARLEKEAAANAKAAEERAKLEQEEADARLMAYEFELEQENQAWQKAQQQKADMQLLIDQGVANLKAQQRAKELKDKIKEDKEQIALEKFKADAINSINSGMFSKKRGLMFAANALFKQNAIQEAVANGEVAAIAAFKLGSSAPFPVGIVLGPLLAAAAVAFTALHVANLTGLNFKFARGGKAATTGGKTHSEGGTKYYGDDGNVVELERGENWYVLNRSASNEINRLSGLNVKHGGVSFGEMPKKYAATGGRIDAGTTGGISAAEIESVVRTTLQNTKIVTLVEDIRSGIDREVSIEDRAQLF